MLQKLIKIRNLLRHFHEVEPAGRDVLNDPAEVRLLAGLRFAGVDAVVVLAGLIGGTLLIPLALTLKKLSVQLQQTYHQYSRQQDSKKTLHDVR